MEGDVEFNDDDDVSAINTITRRLNLTTNATGMFEYGLSQSQSQVTHRETNEEKLYGARGRVLFIKCFQYILKKQVDWLLEEKKFPKVFENVVKIIWMSYLETFNQVLFKNNYDVDNDLLENNDHDTNKIERKSEGLHISLISSISILYMASVHLCLPVNTNDFIRWICSMKLPFFKSSLDLPKSWRKKLPNYYLQILEGGKPPKNGQIYQKVSFTCSKIHFCSKFYSRVAPEILIFKLLILYRLPPDFYFYCKKLIYIKEDRTHGFELLDHKGNLSRKLHEHPELKLVSYFVICIILKFYHDDHCSIQFINEWLNQDNISGEDEVSKERLITMLSYDQKSVKIINNLTSNHASNYLDWIETQFLPKNLNLHDELTLDEQISKRKLFNIIPLETSSSKTLPTFTETLLSNCWELNNSSFVNDELDNLSKKQLCLKVEKKLMKELSIEFGISVDQLQKCITNTAKKLVK